jgi:type I restriction enzyme S subunit
MKIKDIGHVVTGKTPSTEIDEYYGGNIMFISPSDLHGDYLIEESEKTITEEGLNSIETNSIGGLSVLTGCIGWDMGNIAMCNSRCATNQQINTITRFNESIADPRYVYYWLKGKKDYLFSIASVTRTPILSKSVFEDIDIPIPCLGLQKKVANLLSSIDEKIRINNKINDYLEEMAKTIYDYWFVQFDFPNENGKPYKSSGGKMVNSNGHIIPEGWTFCKVQDIISNICTGLNPRDNFKLGTGDIKYITVKNLTPNGTLDFTGCDTIDESARTIVHNRSDIQIGDILFASIAPLGRCYLIQSEPTDWDINESVFSIRANTDIITPAFLYLYFMSDAFIKHATSSSTGSIFKGIRINTLLETELCVPPLSVILKFKERLASIFPLKSKNYEEIQRLSNLRDWLLPMLMNGQATIED